VWTLLWLRFFYFMVVNLGKIKEFTVAKGGQLSKVIEHNFRESFNLMLFNRGRIESLLYVLESIPSVRDIAKEAKVLSMGPRNEGELLLLERHGFRWGNITGLDLFSYSPKIEIMDMHYMTFADNSFDIVVCSRVLSYSENVKKAVSEIVRITKNGGIIAIGLAWSEDSANNSKVLGNRFDGWLDELLGFFEGHVDYIYWRSEGMRKYNGDMTTIFRLKK